ncbi:hypothetical protein ALC60_07515 [Trachymyrmex zeteki]|uniref:Uncharacterized protein n=1 Tax=Mycetomoellerius zeteki TaxID=64791 RepID=A0A151WZK2_9HYME|nr:hypothetical protein ALC60_07515 [Trachymyrmex zeteki]
MIVADDARAPRVRAANGLRLTGIRCGYRSINLGRKPAAQKPLIFLRTMTNAGSDEKPFEKFVPLEICPKRLF